MTRKLLEATGACDADRTEHVLIGENGVGRPVWKCVECGARRVGVFAGVDAIAPTAAATDGGTDQ